MTWVSVWGTETELLYLCSIFSLSFQAYQSSLPKVLTIKQPVWCERSIKLTMPWIIVQQGMSKSHSKTGRVVIYSEISKETCNIRSEFCYIQLTTFLLTCQMHTELILYVLHCNRQNLQIYPKHSMCLKNNMLINMLISYCNGVTVIL